MLIVNTFRALGPLGVVPITGASFWCRLFCAIAFANLMMLAWLSKYREIQPCFAVLGNASHTATTPPDSWMNITNLKCTHNIKEIDDCFLLNNSKAFIPFEEIRVLYELFGSLQVESKTLHIFHSNSPIPSLTYTHDPVGHYMFFDEYNVEKRSRVKLITADEGIPLSVQWNRNGYPYPIQIAQFGLSHFSKLVRLMNSTGTSSASTLPATLPLSLDLLTPADGVLHHSKPQSWLPVGNKDGTYKFSVAQPARSHHAAVAITMKLGEETRLWRYFVLYGDNWHNGSSVHLRVSWLRGSNRTHSDKLVSKELVYACQASPESSQNRDLFLSVSHDKNSAVFWMPSCGMLSDSSNSKHNVTLSRDLVYDLLKAFGQEIFMPFPSSNDQNSAQSLDSILVFVDLIELHAGAYGSGGGGYVSKMLLGKSAPHDTKLSSVDLMAERLFHHTRFLAAVKWFVDHQEEDGTWRIPVVHHLRRRPSLKPGWPSAMAQGHGISLLVRAYSVLKTPVYLERARRALISYNRTVREGGILAYVLGQRSFPWFEEYPSDPGNHVLNGFIYSLIGLYDLAQVDPDAQSKTYANHLWTSGLTSLSTLLSLFDSGTGSFYNLAHVGVVTPTTADASTLNLREDDGNRLDLGPNRARWSYHALHVQQLRTLAFLDPVHSVQWLDTSIRWASYMEGFRSPHN
ncbi:unnamed protein product [Dicrocoelium dendriticum]|nr:unnamed protein product [Dicrocoelium dendriticum]